jgi:hypothetical protein
MSHKRLWAALAIVIAIGAGATWITVRITDRRYAHDEAKARSCTREAPRAGEGIGPHRYRDPDNLRAREGDHGEGRLAARGRRHDRAARGHRSRLARLCGTTAIRFTSPRPRHSDSPRIALTDVPSSRCSTRTSGRRRRAVGRHQSDAQAGPGAEERLPRAPVRAVSHSRRSRGDRRRRRGAHRSQQSQAVRQTLHVGPRVVT